MGVVKGNAAGAEKMQGNDERGGKVTMASGTCASSGSAVVRGCSE
jgi:hypothetical protein